MLCEYSGYIILSLPGSDCTESMSVLSFGQLAPQVSVISYILFVIVADDNKYRVRPKAEVLLSAKPESRPKVMLHIRPKPYVPLKVKRDFRPKTETDSR